VIWLGKSWCKYSLNKETKFAQANWKLIKQAWANPKGVTILIHYDITVNVAGGVPFKTYESWSGEWLSWTTTLQFSSVLTGTCHPSSTNYPTLTPVDINFSSLKALVDIKGVCCDTLHNGWRVTTHALYLKGPEFMYQPEDQLSWQPFYYFYWHTAVVPFFPIFKQVEYLLKHSVLHFVCPSICTK